MLQDKCGAGYYILTAAVVPPINEFVSNDGIKHIDLYENFYWGL